MDIELELDYSDRISQFLRSKLQVVKSENSHLEEALNHRREVLSQLREEVAKTNETSVCLAEVWKKTVNDKYIIGVEINNKNSIVLNDFVVIFDSTSSSAFTYNSYVIAATDPLKPTSSLSCSGRIIIVFPIPRFTDRLSHMLSGSVTFQSNNRKILLKFPTAIELTPQDVTENSAIVHLYKVIDGDIKDVLALIFSGEKHDFVVVAPKNVTFRLEVDCSLCKINLGSERKLFLVQNISPLFDGAVLEVEELKGKPHLVTYCKNVEVTMLLLHYLHQHMKGAIIVPKSYHQPDLSLDELTNELKATLGKMSELSQLSDDLKLMLRMVDLESDSDVLVARINKKRDC